MLLSRFLSRSGLVATVLLTVFIGGVGDAPADQKSNKLSLLKNQFETDVRPFLNEHCMSCHDADTMESGIRVDNLDGTLEDRHLKLWGGIQTQLLKHQMPPEDEVQPSDESRQQMIEWITLGLDTARRRKREKHGTIRRLTVSQYRNSLRELLSLPDDLTEVLPPDAVSKDGFHNNSDAMQMSPLLMEAYFDVAREALRRCIVRPETPPTIQNFRMDFGREINSAPCPDKLILGANSHLLANEDFVVHQLVPQKPFDFTPFFMRTEYRFIEGYQGNSTVRGWRHYDSIYHSVFACVRGTRGYPKGEAYNTVKNGLLLRPAIPSTELFGQSSTYGPQANFKISLRELPDEGQFRVTVKAARYDDALLLEADIPPAPNVDDQTIEKSLQHTGEANLIVPSAGVYQVDLAHAKTDKAKRCTLVLGDRRFVGHMRERSSDDLESTTALLVVRLAAGPLRATVQSDDLELKKLLLTRLDDDHALAHRFRAFEGRYPILGVHLGLRRDCGSTMSPVGEPQPVAWKTATEFIFEGAIDDYPNPDVEKDNVNYLAGVREIGVRSEYTDTRDRPRLRIESIEFEGPYYVQWPPQTHRNIFIESEVASESPAYAREVIQRFATRAFRRPVSSEESASLLNVWQDSFEQTGDFQKSVVDALVVVLTSPQFLLLIESSVSPNGEPLDDYELASKLSYFLWNSPPDSGGIELATQVRLQASLDDEVRRMIFDEKFERFCSQFVSQWLDLDKLGVVETDLKQFPKLTRDAKRYLRREPIEFFQYCVRQNLPLNALVASDFVLANEVVADYYGLSKQLDVGFEFVPVKHGQEHLGGIISQAGILAGLSNGSEANPIKRGAWLARKIIAEPPDDPPPNVPDLPEDEDAKLTLREKLENHRNQKGCVNCHEGIDPWGLPLEQFNAGGLFRGADVDGRSKLPDKTEVNGAIELKRYLIEDRIDQVAFSLLKHLTTYAIGRNLSYNEVESLRENGLKLRDSGYRLQDLIRFVVNSEMFLEK